MMRTSLSKSFRKCEQYRTKVQLSLWLVKLLVLTISIWLKIRNDLKKMMGNWAILMYRMWLEEHIQEDLIKLLLLDKSHKWLEHTVVYLKSNLFQKQKEQWSRFEILQKKCSHPSRLKTKPKTNSLNLQTLYLGSKRKQVRRR